MKKNRLLRVVVGTAVFSVCVLGGVQAQAQAHTFEPNPSSQGHHEVPNPFSQGHA
jgi:hypothetical protein